MTGPAAVDPPDLDEDLGAVDVADLTEGDDVEDALITGALTSGAVGRLALFGCRLDRVQLTGSTFDQLELEDVVLVDCELSGVTLSGAKLRRVRFERCRMSGLAAAALDGEHVAFVEDRLDEAWFRMAELDRVAFVDCDLRQADFYAASLRRTAFVGCDLTSAELSQAVVTALRLERTIVDGLGGIGDLRDVVLSPDVVVDFAVPFLTSFGITVDDGTD